MQSPAPRKLVIEKMPEPAVIGRIFIPEHHRQRTCPAEGLVHSTGSAVKELKHGDKVLVDWSHGGTHQFERNGNTFWLVNETQVLAVIL